MRARIRSTIYSAVAVAVALAGAADRSLAQRADSARAGVAAPRRPRVAPPDTAARPPIAPRRAFVYSALLPGFGQAKLDRFNAGALFVGVEMASIAMAVKSRADLQQARRLFRDSIIVGYSGVDSLGAPRPTYQSCQTSQNIETPCAITQERVRARRLHYEDWIAAILFNHLFAGADAFVAAQLWDLPTQVSARPGDGTVVVSARVTW